MNILIVSFITDTARMRPLVVDEAPTTLAALSRKRKKRKGTLKMLLQKLRAMLRKRKLRKANPWRRLSTKV